MNPKLPALAYLLFLCVSAAVGEERLTPPVDVEGQPLAANVKRVLEALELLGAPLPAESTKALRAAADALDPRKLQELLDPKVLFLVRLDSGKVTVERGPAQAVLQQAGFTPVLLKVLNPVSERKHLRAVSPQSGPVYAGASDLSLRREEQLSLGENQNVKGDPDRFLALEMYASPPLAAELSGLQVEYAVALIYSGESGEREARIGFEIDGAGGKPASRGETALRFQVRPAVKVKLRILDFDGKPAVARLLFRGPGGQVYPPQAKRLAPDLFFQKQVYRSDGDAVLLPPGDLRLEYTRGPEYRTLQKSVKIPADAAASLELKLERWINPRDHGLYSGDHHIHAAGCAHYTSPTEGITPADMLLQVKGEGLNVGCVLTWGPCFEFQRRYFSPTADRLSDPFTVLKYDLEISGFGSQALGHVCLLNLKDQTYPDSDGTKSRGWPTWTTPVLRWAKAQGGFTGYAHSASGLAIDPRSAAKRLLERLDIGKDGFLQPDEAEKGLLPEEFSSIDADGNGLLSEAELVKSHERAAEELPNLAIPEMNGVGAMEIPVSAAMGACDFISAMNTVRIQEWNTWYHLLNCGFPVKVSGETDFPCMSGTRVGQGRVYVRLGQVERIDFQAWCEGLARGRSYVSDGYGHALEFTVEGHRPGEAAVMLDRAGSVIVKAKVAFSRETPLSVAQGGIVPPEGKELVGDTVLLHGSPLEGPSSGERHQGGNRSVEVVVNAVPVARAAVPADGEVHDLSFEIPVEKSAWIALRQFPGLHTNPVDVLVAGKPIRASKQSALWLIDVMDLLWHNREAAINEGERGEARRTFQEAKEIYRRIAAESPAGPGQHPAGRGLEGVKVTRDLVYATRKEKKLLLDLYLPEEVKEPVPVIVWIHGGAWLEGKKEVCPAMYMARRGYAVASIDYRLSSEAVFPAQIEDCKAAIRWLRANARQFHLDPARFGAWGDSAGGHLASLLGTSGDVSEFDQGENLSFSSRVEAVCDFYGPTDFLQMDSHALPGSRLKHDAPGSPESLLIGGPIQENKAKAAKVNPITYASNDDPPFLIVHGAEDLLVPPHQSQLLYDALKSRGAEAKLHWIKGAGHGGSEFFAAGTRDLVEAFFDARLKKGGT